MQRSRSQVREIEFSLLKCDDVLAPASRGVKSQKHARGNNKTSLTHAADLGRTLALSVTLKKNSILYSVQDMNDNFRPTINSRPTISVIFKFNRHLNCYSL